MVLLSLRREYTIVELDGAVGGVTSHQRAVVSVFLAQTLLLLSRAQY